MGKSRAAASANVERGGEEARGIVATMQPSLKDDDKKERAVAKRGDHAAAIVRSSTKAKDHCALQIATPSTPEELYYNECWMALPDDICDAYAVLGYTEVIWEDETGQAPAPAVDDLDWGDLSNEERKAALYIGYTEEMWCTAMSLMVSPRPSWGPIGRPTTVRLVTTLTKDA